ncbi:efflux RND transporter periplasmic adaptor subunit [bacterium]|nr:efflux RND transporter periplasmic adaptor subunit [bacterium]
MRVLVLLIVLLLAAGTASCRPGADGGTAGGFALPVEVRLAEAKTVEDRLSAVGTVAANEVVHIKSEVGGRIVSVGFTEGALVQQGDILFRLNDAKLKAALESAEARFLKATNNLERGRSLLANQTISPQEFDDAQAEFKDANGLLTLARERFNDATIRSPLTGRAGARLISPGNVIDTDQILVTVVETDPMKLDFAVPERFLPQLQVGQQADVIVAALPGRTFTGEVYLIDPQINPSTRMARLKARVPNPDGLLRDGLFANVTLITGTRAEAVVVPEQALVPQIDKVIVFVVEDGQARRREVRLGARLPGEVEIVDGLQAGEPVVTSGQQKLRDQMPVQVLPPPS